MGGLHSEVIRFIFFLVIFVNLELYAEVIIAKVERNIDLTSQLAKISSEVTFENKGSSKINSVDIAVEEDQYKALAFIEVTYKEDDEVNNLDLTTKSVAGQSGKHFSVKLPEPLASNHQVVLHVESVYTHVLRPFPAKIGQSDKQLVLYKANTYYYSPYLVQEQRSTVKVPSSTIESFSRLKPSSSNDNKINYGPYKDTKAYSMHEMKVHLENNSPFLTVREMSRWIELSHWGNVAVEEMYHMVHEGAALEGHFSRYDYQRTPTHAAIKSFKTVLPAAAKDVYYRDEIGNISTSNMLSKDDSVEVELRPRFPLFGGWQTHYHLGYNVAVYEYLFNKGNQYILQMRFIDHIFDDFVIDDATVKVVLPEGATNIRVKVPFDVTQKKNEIHKTYLDTSGRTVIVMSKKNLVENHIQDFELHYTFEKIQLLQEPMLCVAAFYILFISVICIVRLDFSISKDVAKESRMKVASLIEELLSVCDKRSGLCGGYDNAVEKFKQSKDQSAFAAALKKVNQEYSRLTNTISTISCSLTKEEPESSDKISELLKKETERKAVIEQVVALATKVVAGKLGKQQYADNEQTALAKRDKLSEEIETILSTL